MKELSERIAKDLLKVKAVFLNPSEPFTWASGILSPIYCDNRLVLADVSVRKDVEEGLSKLIQTYYPDVEVLMGTSTAGIPHAAYVSALLNLPMGYVRSGAKDHGRKKEIEGADPLGKKVVVVEDLISTGGSVLEVVDILRNAGAIVLGIVSIFTYQLEKGIKRLSEAHINNYSLSNFNDLVEVAVDQAYISLSEKEKLLKFQSNPNDPSWKD